MKKYSILIKSAHWTCLPNLIFCSMLYQYFLKNGHRITKEPTKADFIIISTCGVLTQIEDKTIDLYNNYKNLKRKDAQIIMFGCLLKTNKEKIKNLDFYHIEFEETYKLDLLFYSKIKFEKIKPICDEETKTKLLYNEKTHGFVKRYPFFLTKMFFPFSKKLKLKYKIIIKDLTHKDRIFVLISRGCISNCNYCVIKKAKGRLVSRTIKDILNDIESIYDPKKTLFLVADDCGCYGFDLKTNLIDLLYKINKKFPKTKIDLNYLNPTILQNDADKYVQLFKDISFRYVIVPLQSGSNKIIKKMNRKYDVKKVLAFADKIKKISPDTILYAHFIINYPEENIIDFLKTLITLFHFDVPLPFIYTPMKGTNSFSTIKIVSKIKGRLKWYVFMSISNIVILFKTIKYQKLVE